MDTQNEPPGEIIKKTTASTPLKAAAKIELTPDPEIALFNALEQNEHRTVFAILNELVSDISRKKLLETPHPGREDKKTPMQLILEKVTEDIAYTKSLGAILDAIPDKDVEIDLLQTKAPDSDNLILQNLLDTHLALLNKKQAQHVSLKNFDLFESDVCVDLSESFTTMRNKHFLYILARLKTLDLIHHEYVQRYIRYHWDHHRLFWTHLFTVISYFMCLGSASSAILMACYGQPPCTGREVDHDHEHSFAVPRGVNHTSYVSYGQTVAFGVTAIIPAIFLFIIEILQICAKGWSYWTYPTNYFDLTMPLFAATIWPLTLNIDCQVFYAEIFGTVMISCMWMYGAWKIALLPQIQPLTYDQYWGVTKRYQHRSTLQKMKHPFKRPLYNLYITFHDLKKNTCLTFMMFFKILRSVILSIFLLFYLSFFFSIAMMILLGVQHMPNMGYKNIGHAVMTSFLGKLPYDYKPIFHGEIELNVKEYVAGYMLMLLIFFSLGVTAMNLLIGQAMADVRLIQKTSESLIFQNQVDMIIEFNRIKKKFKLKNCVMFRPLSRKTGGNTDVEEVSAACPLASKSNI